MSHEFEPKRKYWYDKTKTGEKSAYEAGYDRINWSDTFPVSAEAADSQSVEASRNSLASESPDSDHS